MILLYLVAFISGLFTIIAPCIWPLLPLVLGSSITGGHKKPLGLTLGIIVSFGFITLTISYIARIIPINLEILRILAVLVIAVLGAILIIPKLSAILEGYLSRILGRFQSKQSNGFWGGFLTGLSIGVVWTPCAGPILATIAALSVTLSLNSQVILLTFFYLLGVGIPLFIFSILGRRVLTKTRVFSRYTHRAQQVFGVLMILTAIAIFANVDKSIEAKLLDKFPSYSNFITQFEGSQTDNLNSIRNIKVNQNLPSESLFNASYQAPELTGITNWLNTKDPISLASLRGKVVLVDFWTYTCINCIRTLPHVTSWYDKYKDEGLVVLGIHTPEFEFEKNTQNVQNAIAQFKINYPVGQDNNYSTWNAYSNQYWPAHYLIDSEGVVRKVHFGEGSYDEMERAIVVLLNEAGSKAKLIKDTSEDETPTSKTSPETYVSLKGKSYLQFYPGDIVAGTKPYELREGVSDSQWSLGGKWQVGEEYVTSVSDAKINYSFSAKKVFLVLRPKDSTPKKVKVILDGKPIDPKFSGPDVRNGVVTVDQDRLYNLVNLPKQESHVLILEFDDGVQVFAFTFG